MPNPSYSTDIRQNKIIVKYKEFLFGALTPFDIWNGEFDLLLKNNHNWWSYSSGVFIIYDRQLAPNHEPIKLYTQH